MSSSRAPTASDPLVSARRELHELAVLSSALLRLAIKVQTRCDALRHTLGDVGPLDDGEVDLYAPRIVDGVAVPTALGDGAHSSAEDEDPAALLAMSLVGRGLSREQIGDYLQDSFGMEETDALLDRIMPADGERERER